MSVLSTVVLLFPHRSQESKLSADQSTKAKAHSPPLKYQSVTSRLETSRYRDFSQFFFRVSVSVSKILVSKKSIGIGLENI